MPIDKLSANAFATGAVANSLGYTPANKAGDTFTGNVVFSATANVTGAATFSNTVAIGSDYISPYMGFKNRFINGDMRIDQRAGASNTADNGAVFCLDRWQIEDSTDGVFTGTQSSDVPTGTGFKNSLKLTVTTADTSIASNQFATFTQHIEGYNWADMNWGAASASTVTLSFWVKSSVVGTYTSFVSNNGSGRWYVQGFTINSANTWEYKTIVIPGDTSGTWLTTTGRGASFQFHLAHGGTQGSGWSAGTTPVATGQVSSWMATVGNTFYITGVQVEKGSTATAFDYRDYGRELIMCQRYYEKSYDYGTAPGTSSVLQQAIGLGIYTNNPAAYNRFGHVYFKVAKRSGPTVVLYAPATGSSATASNATSGDGATNIGYCQAAQVNQYGFNIAASVGGSTNTNYYTAFFAFTAEAEL